ncbi:MAG: flippase-like domain-containing protein [Methylococcaceae bacterium]|nr:flippase-like domain-containing protein [Methylococcaceae bacterium]
MWLIIRKLDVNELMKLFASARLEILLAATLAFMVGYACRIARWQVMLKRDNPQLRWLDCAGPLLASFAANNVLPFRAGDVMRTFAFNKQLGSNSSTVLATLFVERLLDLLMVLLLLGGALGYFGLDANRFAGVGTAALILLALLILIVLCFPHLFMPLANLISRTITRFAPSFGEKLGHWIQNALETLQHLSGAGIMSNLIGWSLAAWLAEGGVFLYSAIALSALPAPNASWLALPVGTLATLIPSTPGYVGTFDYFIVRAMTALNNPETVATAYALLVHIILWLPPTVVGGLYLLLKPTKLLNSGTPT